ncbi:MAG: amidase [Devosia sp.]
MSQFATCQLNFALEAAARTESEVRAYKHLLRQTALEAATYADANPTSSPVQGWPFAVKEVLDVAGVVTAGGSQAYADRIPATDATAVKRLKSAGGVLVGTHIAHELTCGFDQPPTRNPWNIACYPGGSSAGAGVSVAVGSARFALGTDAAGSVRIPAAMTGTTGLKPTWGLISAHGVMREASAPSIDHVGIIARSAEDISQILPVIAGPDPWDPATLQARPALDDVVPNIQRAAILGDATFKALSKIYPLDPEVRTAFSDACAVLHKSGVEITTFELPTFSKAVEAIVTFFSAELAPPNMKRLVERKSDYTPSVADMIEAGFAMPTELLLQAIDLRCQLRQELADAFALADTNFLLTPTTPRPSIPLEKLNPAEDLVTFIPFTCGFNLTGNPAISVPCGYTSDGLPIGLQIVSRHFMEAALLDLAIQFQKLTDWHERRPPL